MSTQKCFNEKGDKGMRKVKQRKVSIVEVVNGGNIIKNVILLGNEWFLME